MNEIDVMRGRIEAVEQQEDLVYELARLIECDGDIIVMRGPACDPLGRLKVVFSGSSLTVLIDGIKEKLQREESKLREMIAGLTAPL